MTSLVTGGAGFIGRHLVEALRARGDRVRILDTGASPDDSPVSGPPAEFLKGSILDLEVVSRALEGVEVVYHLAAIPHLWTRDVRDYDRVNRAGTENLLGAALDRKIGRFIHCSSEAVLFPPEGSGRAAHESNDMQLADMPGPYTRSKFLAEQAALSAARSGLAVTIVNPTLPVGPGDRNVTPPTAMLELFVSRPPMFFLDCTLNLVDVRDVAQGILLAQSRGRVGERYILGGENFSLGELAGLLDRMSGRSRSRRSLPRFIALAAGFAGEMVATHLTRRPPLATEEGVRLALRSVPIDSGKSRRELGYRPRAVGPALAQVVREFQAANPILASR